VYAGSDSTVYVASRDIGHAIKVSLHPIDPSRPGEEWRLAWTSEHVARHGLPDGHQNRVLDAWDSESRRLDEAPLKHAFAVVLGRFSMGLHPLPEDDAGLAAYRRRLAKVDWVQDYPDLDEAWQFNVMVGDPGYNIIRPPGRRGMNAAAVGKLTLPTRVDVWVVRNRIKLDDDAKAQVQHAANGLVQTLGKRDSPGVYRGHLTGDADGLHFFAEVAVTWGGNDDDFVL
jgi:hypothetical protein